LSKETIGDSENNMGAANTHRIQSNDNSEANNYSINNQNQQEGVGPY
tara:strand:+ start:295 stop:435 length:141 start_codon:yes stop_codon:yes gene_type:complete